MTSLSCCGGGGPARGGGRGGGRGLGAMSLIATDDALRWLAVESDGDARRALNVLEAAAEHTGRGAQLTVEVLPAAMRRRAARYGKSGEEHFNPISAYHKVLRGSDPQGALY